MHDLERSIAAIAGSQDNVATREQLLAAGLGRGAISHRIKSGSMRGLHRGVYLLGYAPPSDAAVARAAALASGPGAAISHRSAAALWGLMEPPDGFVHVTATHSNPGARPGIRLHRVPVDWTTEVTEYRGIPLTSCARTICDLAADEPIGEVEDALTQALGRRLVLERELREVIARAPTRQASARLRTLLEREQERGYTRAGAEQRLRRLLRRSGLPLPEFNARTDRYIVDCLWRRERLIAEVDGYGTHGPRAAFESDRRRDQILVAAGFRVIRITWRQLCDEPFGVLVRIARALAVGTG